MDAPPPLQPSTGRSQTGCKVLGCLILLGGLGICVHIAHGILQGIRDSERPAIRHFRRVDQAELLGVCRQLMDDPQRHGTYADPVRLSIALELTSYTSEWERGGLTVDQLPPVLRELKQAEVFVKPSRVQVKWDGHGYGYSLIVLRESEGEEARFLREHNGTFNRAVELEPGVWSYFVFH